MKTMKVRIAVAINDKGEWSSFGYHLNGREESDTDICLQGMALEGLESGMGFCEMVHFIEAEIPIPESQTIQGEVVRSEKVTE